MADLMELNGRRYRKPEGPTVIICADGCDPRYIERGIADGILPTIASFQQQGYLATAAAAMPTFTNPNNVSIVTGVPPAVHGIAGNYYLDRDTEREIMMTDERLMRGETILALMARAEHDLSGLAGHRLRSHGGLGEQLVPFILSRRLTPEYRGIAATRRLRNFDIFDFALNGVE